MSTYRIESPPLVVPPLPDDIRWTGPILTVADLRRMTANMPGSTQVVLPAGGWYVNVGEVRGPIDEQFDTEYQCLTLFPGSAFDSRQV